MRQIFLCVLALFALAFAENVTTTEPRAGTSTFEAEVIVSTTGSSRTTSEFINSSTTNSSPTKPDVIVSTTTESSPATMKVTEGSTTDRSPTKLEVISSTTTESSPAPDKPSEDAPSKTPSFQYFAVPFIPLNGLIQNFSGQYGVLPPVFGGIIVNPVGQQMERKQVEEPEREPEIQPTIESPAPAKLPEFLQGISSMQELTEMVFHEMLNQQRGNGTCGGFIELVGKAEINHKISWGLPPADVESCSWVIWAQGGGPIIVDFPEGPNAKFIDSLSSLWILDLNETQGYRKTLMKPGVKTFDTNFMGIKGFFPFIIVHMLVKQTQPDQRLHLKFFDQAGNFSMQLKKNVMLLNETYGRHAIVHHPASQSSRYERTERFFLMGQTPKGRRVSLGIYPIGLPRSDYTWIQISWIDLDSFKIHQEKTTLGTFVRRNFQVDLKPSTSFVVVFCSYNAGTIGKGFDLTYEFY